MNEKKPIELMADLLAEMTIRATEAERQRGEAEERENSWYQNYLRQEAKLREAEAKLSEEIREHNNTKQKCRELLDRLQKAGTENA